MISCFVKEQKRYSKDELCELLQFSSEDVGRTIKRMKEYGVLKTVNKSKKQLYLSELAEEDVLILDEDDDSVARYYVFVYVGVLMVENRVIKCCPKYFLGNEKDNKQEWENELKLVLRVLQKYQSKNQVVQLYLDGKENTFNQLGAMVYFINDYFDNGVYSNTEEIIEINGSGEPMWDRIINETYAVIQNNQPIYAELKTRRRVENKDDFFMRLHKCLISECTVELEKAGLTKLLNIEGVNLSDETLEDLGDTDYILYKLERELRVQYNTHKQELLTAMIAFFEHRGVWDTTEKLNLYGSTSFNLVWEAVCAEVFSNVLHTPICDIDFPVVPDEVDQELENEELISVIEHPKWYGIDEGGTIFEKEANVTLRPDLAYLYKNDEVNEFVIFDAKYYCITLLPDKSLKGQPGVEDITKQYLYQVAFREFMNDRGVDSIKNAFLVPSYSSGIRKMGYASLSFMERILKVSKIVILSICATELYNLYLLDNEYADMNNIFLLCTEDEKNSTQG